jgi:hypothetical protein
VSKVILNTNTELQRNPGLIGIYTYYVEFDKNLLFFVCNNQKIVNDVFFNEGELGYTNNDWTGTYFLLNENGELIVVSDEADKFSINSNGELEYTDMAETRNLGQVSAFIAGTVPPVNTSLIWYDTNDGVYLQKYWNVQSGDWVAFVQGLDPVIMYRQDLAAVNGTTTITFRSELPSTDYVVEILSFTTLGLISVASGWTVPEISKTVEGFQIVPPSRYPEGNIVYRATLYV